MSDWRTQRRAVVVAALAWCATSSLARGQESDELNVDVADCVKLETADARLACYESRVSSALEERAASEDEAPTPAPRRRASKAPRAEAEPPAAVAARVSEPEPAASAPARAADTPRGRDRSPAGEEIVSRIESLRETVPNAYLITLENGQVWRQTRPEHYPLRPGLEVRIYGTRWGPSSRLTSEQLNGFIQVKQVQ